MGLNKFKKRQSTLPNALTVFPLVFEIIVVDIGNFIELILLLKQGHPAFFVSLPSIMY